MKRTPIVAVLAFLVCLVLAPGVAAAPAAAVVASLPGPTSDPLARLSFQQAQLVAPGGATLDMFGASVAVSGNTALVGAPHAWVDPPAHEGVAYVFVRSGGVWTWQATLIAGDHAADDRFGASVALSGDTALVGAPGHDTGGRQNAGAAYVFVRSGSTWTQQGQLTGDYVQFGAEGFGAAVALEGDTALVGAPMHNGVTFAWVGAAYVFVRSGGAWSQQGYLVLRDPYGNVGFGSSVALSGDTVLIGAPNSGRYADEGKGAAYLFVRDGIVWKEAPTFKLTAGDAAIYDYFGSSVAISGDTALIGAPGRGVAWSATEDHGAAYVFVRSGTAWTQDPTPWTGDGAIHDVFGTSLALSGDVALVGGPQANGAWGPAGPGHAWVFTRSAGAWSRQQRLAASDGAQGEAFGISVALSGDTFLVGAQWHGATPSWPGAAYVFGPTAPTFTVSVSAGPGGGITPTGPQTVAFGGSISFTITPDDGYHVADVLVDGVSQGAIASYQFSNVTADHAIAASFAVTPPAKPSITSLSPTAGKRRGTVTIAGSGFGATRGTGFVTFGSKKCSTYLLWSDTRIRCKVPAAAVYGSVKVKVTTAGGSSNAKSFTVKR